MFCRNCGSKIEDGAQFCAVYGASVVPDDQAQTGGANPCPLMLQHLSGRSKSTWRPRLLRPAPNVPRSRSSSLPSWWLCSPWVAEPVITLASMRRSRHAKLPSKRPSPQSTPCGLRSRPRVGHIGWREQAAAAHHRQGGARQEGRRRSLCRQHGSGRRAPSRQL